MTTRPSFAAAIVQAATPKRLVHMVGEGIAVIAAPAAIHTASSCLATTDVTPMAVVAGIVGVGVCALVSVGTICKIWEDGEAAAENPQADRVPLSAVGDFAASVRAYRQRTTQDLSAQDNSPATSKILASNSVDSAPTHALPSFWRPPM